MPTAEEVVTAAKGFVPSELELLIKQELRKMQEVPDALMVQIIRDGGSWRAETRFKVSHRGLSDDSKADLAAKVSGIGRRLAPSHPLVG